MILNQITYSDFAGVYSSGATPVPIPNTEVKSACGNGIAGLTLWESSATPALFLPGSRKWFGFFYCLDINSVYLYYGFVEGLEEISSECQV